MCAARRGESPYFGSAPTKGAAADGCRHHQRIEERVTLKDMAVEVGQRRNPGHVGTIVLGDEREPQSQLGEAHGCGCQIYAEQRARQHIALDGQSRPVAGRAPKACHLIECSEQERTRSCGRVRSCAEHAMRWQAFGARPATGRLWPSSAMCWRAR